MSKYTLWDPNLGNIPLATALAATAIAGTTIDNTPIGATTPSSGAFTTLAASGLSILSTVQMAGLSATQISLATVTGTVTVTGATPTATVGFSGMTANTIVNFTLKTVGGTVAGAPPNVALVIPGVGFTVKGTASDTSVYNFIAILVP